MLKGSTERAFTARGKKTKLLINNGTTITDNNKTDWNGTPPWKQSKQGTHRGVSRVWGTSQG